MTHHIPEKDLAEHIQAALATTPSRLPDSDLLAFVERHFANGRRILDTISPSVSPCYLFETDMIAERANVFRKAFESRLPDTGFYFAMKSNNCPDVSRTVLQTGFGLDVSSGVELAVALDLGAEDIVFSGPGKTETELSLAMAHSDRVVILVDSFTELGRLSRLAERRKRTMSIGVRLTNDPRGLWRKFGIPCEQLKAFIDQCQTLPFIDFSGLQFHSSWNMGPERQIDFICDLGRLIDTLTDDQRRMIRFIDIGGGYWPEDGEWMQPAATVPGQVRQVLSLPDTDRGPYLNPSTPIERFAEILSEAITRHLLSRTACRICFEPGRFICHDAMHLFLTVLDKKYDDLVITDAGTNMVGWERFEVDYFPVLNLTRPALSEKPCMILGSLCTPHDVWGYSYWGDDIREGDILMIPTQGAYTFSLRQHFIKPVPDVIIYP